MHDRHGKKWDVFTIRFYWGELERAPHRRVGLGFCHSRYIYIYIYIGIGGPTAIFEPAPFLQPCTFFWPDLVDRKHVHTEPRITRIPMHNTRLRSRAHCAHTNARPLISGQQKVHDVRSDRVSFQSRTRSTSTSRKYSTRLNVNVVARSTLMRAHIAMHNAVVRPGYLQQSP